MLPQLPTLSKLAMQGVPDVQIPHRFTELMASHTLFNDHRQDRPSTFLIRRERRVSLSGSAITFPRI